MAETAGISKTAKFIGLGIDPNHEPLTGRKNDLFLDENGDLALVYDAEAIGQHVRQRLMFWKGEWFLNEEAGIDFLRYIFGKVPAWIPIGEAILKREVALTPGVTEIIEFDTYYDRASRGLILNKVSVVTQFDDPLDIRF